MTRSDKDWWDKAEIAGKFFGPLVIAIGAGAWGYAQVSIQSNAAESQAALQAATARSQAELQAATARSQAELQSATAHTQMAISILSAAPSETVGDLDALREWAVGTIRDPSNPPEFDDSAAQELAALSKSGQFPNAEAIPMPYLPEHLLDGRVTTTEEFLERLITPHLRDQDSDKENLPQTPSPPPQAIPLPYPLPEGGD